MAAPSKAEQEAESRARAEAGIDPGETAAATATIDDVANADPAPARADAAADPAPAPAPPVKGQFDDKRSEIINRFRQQRTAEKEDEADEISEFARSGVPQDFQQEAEAEPAATADAEAQPEPAAIAAAEPPKTVKVKVHGVEKELSLDELIAKAQIAMASEDILENAKSKAKEIDNIVEQARNKVARSDPAGANQTGENRAPNADATATGDPAPENQRSPAIDLIESLQFRDPSETAPLLEKTIRETSREETRNMLAEDRLRDEGARTAKVLKDFEDKHSDLAADPMARAAIEQKVCQIQTDDLKKLGVDFTKLHTRIPGVVSPDDIAFAHRWYRSQNFQVSAPDQMLETAVSEFLKWKTGGQLEQPKPADPAPSGKPQVEIQVDRTARRAALQPQPSRAAAPKPDASRQTAQPRDRSSIVQQMAARRAAPRGKVLAS